MNAPDLNKQYEYLKTQLRSHRDDFSQVHSTRLHRSLSWFKAAAEQIESDNLDQAFINLWISFSACFYMEGDTPIAPFIDKLIALDSEHQIYDCLWHEYSVSVKALIKNPYVFEDFWQAQRALRAAEAKTTATATDENKDTNKDTNKETNEESGLSEAWRASFDRSSVEALNYLSRKKVAPLFSIVLDRLYVLRNQVLQGGATYQSRVNREQVTDGVNLLASIMPIIIGIMLASADQDWGEIAYPVISQHQS